MGEALAEVMALKPIGRLSRAMDDWDGGTRGEDERIEGVQGRLAGAES